MRLSAIPLALASTFTIAACGDDKTPGNTGEVTPDTSPETGDATEGETADTVEPEVVAPTFCEGATTFAWDPDDDSFLATYPSDALTVDDATTRTGVRVHVGDPKWLGDQPAFFQSVWRQIESLDGFGTSAGVMLRFSAPLADPPSGSSTATSDQILLLDLAVDPPVAIPYETEVLDEGATLLLWPMVPLREEALHGVVVTTLLKDTAGNCIAPSAPLRQLISGIADENTPTLARLQGRFDTLRAAAASFDVAPGDISAATVFTTQAFTAPTLAQREHLTAQTYEWRTRPRCTEKADYIACEGDFTAYDYRIEGYLGAAFDPEYEPKTYVVPVHLWLPLEHGGELPVLFFGHGLGGEAAQAGPLAELAASRGLATVAISAPRHGDHPTATSSDPQAVFTAFFGIDLGAFSIDGFVFRENLRQAAFDKLQVMELLRSDSDVDGDDQPDLDLGRVSYWGISLGGILGPNFIGMSDIGLAIFSVAGGRMISIVSEAEDFQQFFDILATLADGPDNLLRQAPVAQTLIDGADPVNWATHMLKDPIGRPDVPAPHVLLQVVIGDGTVPNGATRSLARALGVPQVPAIITPVDLLDAEAAAPVEGNRDGTTAGLFQFDRYSTAPGGKARRATHAGVFSGIEAIDQVTSFIATWLLSDEKVPSIIDPYATNGTPPL